MTNLLDMRTFDYNTFVTKMRMLIPNKYDFLSGIAVDEILKDMGIAIPVSNSKELSEYHDVIKELRNMLVYLKVIDEKWEIV